MFDRERGRITKQERVLVLLIGFGAACWALWLLGRTHEHIPRCKSTTTRPQYRRRNMLKRGAMTFVTRANQGAPLTLPRVPKLRVLDDPRTFLPNKGDGERKHRATRYQDVTQ